MSEIKTRILALQEQMKQRNMDAYIIPTEDYHNSEYVGAYFKTREYMSGFTGSAGTLVVLKDIAALWTDGRYFLQAAQQLEGSGIDLMKSGEKDVPKISEYLAKQLGDGSVIGFDGRCVSNSFVQGIEKAMKDKKIHFADGEDLVDIIWKNRPELSKKPVWELEAEVAGMSRKDKLAKVREKMTESKADILVMTALDEIAWLLNLRGDDVAYTPVFLSDMLIEKNKATLFVQNEIMSTDIIQALKTDGIELADYNSIDECLGRIVKKESVWLDENQVNYHLTQCIPEGVKLIKGVCPVEMLKAAKTTKEMENIRLAHIKDGVAVTRFLYWLKNAVKTQKVTEIEAANRLLEFRKEQEGFLDQSFEPIMAYGKHGAIIHYSATEETNVVMEPKGLCLSDTGAHYLEGTTDITRTIVLGELTADEKKAFTLVLKGNLALGNAKFPEGVTGQNLDILARQPLWEYGMDFNHGTGHGVGYILNVHEGPQRIHWRIRENAVVTPFVEGMIVSNEPGYYQADAFGIRHENLVLCKLDEKTEYGQFLCFDTLTMVPFDLDGIDVELMNSQEIEWLNAYHKKVYDVISPYLKEEEKMWLAEATQPLMR